jgi:hypothetical protein
MDRPSHFRFEALATQPKRTGLRQEGKDPTGFDIPVECHVTPQRTGSPAQTGSYPNSAGAGDLVALYRALGLGAAAVAAVDHVVEVRSEQHR